jgi:hypothetical protein
VYEGRVLRRGGVHTSSRTFRSPRDYSDLQLRVRRHDGVVVSVNGTEVARSNMPPGEVRNDTVGTRPHKSQKTIDDAVPIRRSLVP